MPHRNLPTDKVNPPILAAILHGSSFAEFVGTYVVRGYTNCRPHRGAVALLVAWSSSREAQWFADVAWSGDDVRVVLFKWMEAMRAKDGGKLSAQDVQGMLKEYSTNPLLLEAQVQDVMGTKEALTAEAFAAYMTSKREIENLDGKLTIKKE